jgi:hypothetical protein
MYIHSLPPSHRKSLKVVSTWTEVSPNGTKSPSRSHSTLTRATALARIWKCAV